MIDKIQFSVSIFICILTIILCWIYYKIKLVQLTGYYLTQEFINQKTSLDTISLGFAGFLLIYCLIYIVTYKAFGKKDVVKNSFINFFFILFLLNMIYLNSTNFDLINKEKKNFEKKFFDVPNFPLDHGRYLLFIGQGLIILIISITLINELIDYYRGLKNLILTYFQNGGRILYFELRNLIC